MGTLLTHQQVLSFSELSENNSNTHSLWVPESWGREVFSTLGALSQVTKKVKLGTSIASIFSRTPATMAMGSLTMDYLSNNRFILGLGVSTPAIVENLHGLNYENPLEKISEYVECIRRLISGNKVTYNGRHYKIDNFKMGLTPNRFETPIYLAAINKKMMELSSAIADGIILYLKPISILEKTVSLIKNNIEQSTRNKNRNFEICSVFITSISNQDPHSARLRAAKTLAFYTAVGKFYNKFLSKNGFKNEVDNILNHYTNNGLEGLEQHISEKMLEELTVCGTGEEARKKLSKIIDSGITLPIIQLNPLDKTENSIKEILSSFSPD